MHWTWQGIVAQSSSPGSSTVVSNHHTGGWIVIIRSTHSQIIQWRDQAADVTWHTISTIPGMVTMNGFDAFGTMLWALATNTKGQTILLRSQNAGRQWAHS